MRILTLCGSLRRQSSNRSLLHAYGQLFPASVTVEHHTGIGALPLYNPDLDHDVIALPPEVEAWRHAVNKADVIAISTPEYAHGLPGAFKNALDWLVSDPAFPGKSVVILHVARGTTWALDSLREVLRTMSARLIEDASVSLSLGTNQIDAAAILARDELRAPLAGSVIALMRASDAT